MTNNKSFNLNSIHSKRVRQIRVKNNDSNNNNNKGASYSYTYRKFVTTGLGAHIIILGNE